jgi:hypothetical protein
MEGTSAATTPSAAAKDAGGTGNASGSSTEDRPARERLDTPDDSIFRSPNPNSALPERKPPQNPQNPIWRPNVAPKPPDDWDRGEARAERRDPAYEPDRDDGSRLPERKS